MEFKDFVPLIALVAGGLITYFVTKLNQRLSAALQLRMEIYKKQLDYICKITPCIGRLDRALAAIEDNHGEAKEKMNAVNDTLDLILITMREYTTVSPIEIETPLIDFIGSVYDVLEDKARKTMGKEAEVNIKKLDDAHFEVISACRTYLGVETLPHKVLEQLKKPGWLS